MASFLSRYRTHVLVMRPGRYTIDQQGVRLFIPGRRVEFREFRLNTDDEDEIAFLRGHKKHGVEFWEVTDADKQIVQSARRMSRGAATTATARGAESETPVPPGDAGAGEAEAVLACPECGKEPPEGHANPAGWLRGHQISTGHGMGKDGPA
jgi:hypothetical protein